MDINILKTNMKNNIFCNRLKTLHSFIEKQDFPKTASFNDRIMKPLY